MPFKGIPFPLINTEVQQKKWRIFIRDLILPCHIGIWEHEKKASQPVRFTIECLVVNFTPDTHDSIDKVVCYDQLLHKLECLVKERHIHFLETLGEEVATLCLEDPRIEEVFIRMEKVGCYTHASSVGVELTRKRYGNQP